MNENKPRVKAHLHLEINFVEF